MNKSTAESKIPKSQSFNLQCHTDVWPKAAPVTVNKVLNL